MKKDICSILGIKYPIFQGGMAWVSESFGWYYMLVVAAYSIFALFVGFSKYGDIKLGQDHEKAQFPFLAWAAMLFSAGIGIDFSRGKDFLGRSQANAEDVSQADFHTLFSGQVNTSDTCHVLLHLHCLAFDSNFDYLF